MRAVVFLTRRNKGDGAVMCAMSRTGAKLPLLEAEKRNKLICNRTGGTDHPDGELLGGAQLADTLHP